MPNIGDRIEIIKTEDEVDLPLGWKGNIVKVHDNGNIDAFLDNDPGPPAYGILPHEYKVIKE
jgi:hypothetical protein